MEFIKYAWLVFIIFTTANYFFLKSQTQKIAEENPDLKPGYDKLLKVILIYGNIPWVIMAIGDLTGQTNSIFDYFNPRSFNPFVLAFHFYLIVIWVLSFRWIYFKKGADFLVQHPGLVYIQGFGKPITPTSKLIKVFFALSLLGGIIGMATMWLANFPKFPVK